jgi:hypothetical protein
MHTRHGADILLALLAVLAFLCFVVGLAGVVYVPDDWATLDVAVRVLPAAGSLLLLAVLIDWRRGAHR